MSVNLATSGAFNTPGTGYTVPLSSLIAEFNLEVLTSNIDTGSKQLTQANINRPALQLSGFFEYFDTARLQIIGMVEHTYLLQLDPEFRKENLRRIFEHGIPAIIVCRKLGVFPEMLEYAETYNVPILSTDSATTDFIG